MRQAGWLDQGRWSSLAAGALLVLHGGGAAAAAFPADGAWIPLTQGGTPAGDVATDGATNGREVVGSAAEPAAYIYNDGTDFFARLRLDSDPRQGPTELRPFAWGLLIDTDGNLAAYEYSLIVYGVGSPDTIEFGQNTSPSNTGDPADPAETTLQSYIWSSAAGGNGRVMDAASSFNGDADYFLDAAVPLADLVAAGISATTPLVIIAGTSTSGNALSIDLVGTTTAPGPGSLPLAATDPVLPDGSPAGTICGDGLLAASEACDDHNTAPADGCSPACVVEAGWICTGLPSVCRPISGPDPDGDGVLSDGDGSGVAGDQPCANAVTTGCDDNCPLVANADQGDQDGDLQGDACDADVDGDGLDDLVEIALGTSPVLPDTDGDGIADGADDADGDGIPNSRETVGGTSAPDTDGDGSIDALDDDSDGDGVPDAVEGEGDADGDSIPDFLDPDPSANADRDGDGFADNLRLGGGGLATCTAAGASPVLVLLLSLCRRRRR